VHGLYAFIPGEFDDYIATPKDNHYRSIHTAVIGPQDRAVEIQIRTQEMHAQAELGLAAHWRYKEGGSRDKRNEQRIEWLRSVLGTEDPVAAADSSRPKARSRTCRRARRRWILPTRCIPASDTAAAAQK
jgi:GTP pyrophosphokinase